MISRNYSPYLNHYNARPHPVQRAGPDRPLPGSIVRDKVEEPLEELHGVLSSLEGMDARFVTSLSAAGFSLNFSFLKRPASRYSMVIETVKDI